MAKKIEKNKIKEKVKEKPKLKSVSKIVPKKMSVTKPSAKPKVTPKTVSKVIEKSVSKPAPKKNVPTKNVIVSYAKIDNSLKLELIKKYPEGYTNYVHRYPKPNGEFFFAVPLDVGDMHYLIKVEVKVDNIITEDEFDKHFGDIAEVDSKVIGEVEVDNADDDDDEEEQMAEDADDDNADDDDE
jgi:hypothetical protein